jgi:hypothetical protein
MRSSDAANSGSSWQQHGDDQPMPVAHANPPAMSVVAADSNFVILGGHPWAYSADLEEIRGWLTQ